MIRVSEGVYIDVQRSDILKIEMFQESDMYGFLAFTSNLGEILFHTDRNCSAFYEDPNDCIGKIGYFEAQGHDVTKHMIGRTVGEAIDWIKTKSGGAK